MMPLDELLFSNGDSFSAQESQRQSIRSEVAAIDSDRFLNTNAEDLIGYLVDKFAIHVPQLHEGDARADQREAKRDVSGDPSRLAYHIGCLQSVLTGTEITVEIPFTGDATLFKIRPSSFDTSAPRGLLRGNTITFRYWTDDASADRLRPMFNEWLAKVKKYLAWQEQSFQTFNNILEREIREAVERRRSQLLSNQNLVAALGIPLKLRSGAAQTFSAPEVRRKLIPKAPPATAGSYTPEPILEEAEYDHILGILESMVHVMERSPRAFHNIDEESLRTHFLLALNSHYEGQATGETFNYQGKTDILIRSGDRNIFIAECKFWTGPGTIPATINQLLGYLSWRDTKAAILLFNRNKDFSKVLSELPRLVREHPNFQKDERQQSSTRTRYAFRQKDDPAKVVHVTVMAFDIPKMA